MHKANFTLVSSETLTNLKLVKSEKDNILTEICYHHYLKNSMVDR